MSTESILKRFEKTAKKDMPDFLDQDRPESVKRIYKALKRDHPDMPAEMKARIAARQGKKGKQKQGPPYKGPITPWKEKKSAKLSQPGREKLKSKQFAIPTYKAKKIGVSGQIKGKAKGKYPIHDIAHARNALARVSQYGTPAEKAAVRAKVKARYPEIGMKKKAEAVTESLNTLWLTYGPDQEEIEKNAAAEYFYNLQKPTLDEEAFGSEFCKLASAFDMDPWSLSSDVEDNFEAFATLAKTASDPRARELAQFYVDWADELEKRAIKGWLARMGTKALGGGGMRQAAKGVTQSARKATIGAPMTRSAVKAQRKQMAAQETARRSAARAQSQSGAQAALQRRTAGLGTPGRRAQKQLKKSILQKRRAAGQATTIRKPTTPTAKPGGTTLGHKILGGTILGGLGLGAAHLATQGGQPQPQPGYY